MSNERVGGIYLGIFDKAKPNDLTAAEVSALWLQYTGDSMGYVFTNIFLILLKTKRLNPF
jgi:hypothetical protein